MIVATETRSFGKSSSDIRRGVRIAVNRIRRELTKCDESGNRFVLRFPTTLLNWGQRVTILIEDNGTVTVTSESTNPAQLFDFGRNRRNVRRLFNLLSAELSRLG
jgi:hypothetical protein